MKEISKNQIIEKIKEEYEEGRQWCRLNSSHCYKMMINTEDAAIWSDCLDESNWNVYRSETVKGLDNEGGYVSDIEGSYIDQAVKLLEEAGWTITE